MARVYPCHRPTSLPVSEVSLGYRRMTSTPLQIASIMAVGLIGGVLGGLLGLGGSVFIIQRSHCCSG